MRIWVLVVLAVSLSGCSFLARFVKGRALVDQFNGSTARTEPPFTSCEDEVGAILKDTLADAFYTPGALKPVDPRLNAAAPEVLARAVQCLRDKRAAGLDDRPCFDCVFGGTCATTRLPFPAAPLLSSTDATTWQTERDVERAQHGLERALRAVAQSCAVSQGLTTAGNPAAELLALQHAFQQGLGEFFVYFDARKLTRRPDKPVTTWVLGGGAANGAFSAGAAWWLLTRHQACGSACSADRVDLLGGASTGTLIASLVKNYFNPTAVASDKQRAIDELAKRYTCSTSAELYCVQDVSLYDLAFADAPDKRGLVDFDGLRQLLEASVGDLPHVQAQPEQFASTVEYESGRVYHFSSLETRHVFDWRDALEGSIVEPFVAEPVKHVGLQRGTFVDGGVRSGLPLLTALRRGAERAVIFVNTALEGVPTDSVPKATAVVFRTIDLFSLQPILGELSLAEHDRLLRREGEKERCLSRLGFDTAGADAATIEKRCSRVTAEPLPLGPPVPLVYAKRTTPLTQPPTPTLERLTDAYRGSWLFMPPQLPARWDEVAVPAPGSSGPVTWKNIGAVGYQFKPADMWNLFALGALVAQQRCRELVDTMSWSMTCATDDELVTALKAVRAQFDAKGCAAKSLELRDCGTPVPPL